MAYNRHQAHALLNAAEYALFEVSLADSVGTLTPAQLKSKTQRVRRLRDKQRDLLQRQRLTSRAKTGNKSGTSGSANVRTEQKAQILDEVLTRLDKRAAELDKRAAELDKRAAAKARRESARNASVVRKASKGSKSAARATPKTPEKSFGKPKRDISAKATHTLPKLASDLPDKKPQMGKDRFRAVLGHVSASGRRAQGKRDAR